MNRNRKNSSKDKSAKRNKKKFSKKTKVIIFSVIVVIITILAGIVGTYIYKADGNITNAAINILADVVGDETPISVLVMGVSEGIDTPLTDTIILVGYNPKIQASFMLSIPRDTFIGDSEAKANGYDKINALYQTNVNKTISAVKKLTGINVDNYVVIKTSALVQMVDAIGGVEFDVPIDMKYDDSTQNLHIDLKKGVQVLNGNQAEQLLRYRHSNPDKNGKMTTYPASYGSDDFGRMRTQREFITAAVNQMVSWKNITKMKGILSSVFDNLETNMSLAKMIGYVPSALKLDTSLIRAEQLPGESALINSLWFYKADINETKDLMDELIESLGLSEKERNKMYAPITSKKSSSSKTKEDINNDFNTFNVEKTKEPVQESSTQVNNSQSSVLDNPQESTSQNQNNVNNVVSPENCSHNWKLIINHEPTCAESGARNYECTICHSEKNEVIPATGNHVWKETSRVEPTETSEGSIVSQCTICKTINKKVLDKLPAQENNTGAINNENSENNGNNESPNIPSEPTNPNPPEEEKPVEPPVVEGQTNEE